MSTSTSASPRKKRRFSQYVQNIKDSYTISRRTYPWLPWALLGTVVLVVALSVVLAAATGQALWYWIIMGLLLALMLDMVILSWTVRRASYTQIEGMPGAAKAVLDQAGRGWFVESDPAAINPRTQDVVWRLVGRPGIVLIAEGPTNRTRRMVTDEQKKVSRILSTVPLHVIHVGTEADQTRLIDLQKTLRRLPTKPTKLTDAEIAQISRRLSSLSSKSLPIPKGVDPSRARIDRRAMRGR